MKKHIAIALTGCTLLLVFSSLSRSQTKAQRKGLPEFAEKPLDPKPTQDVTSGFFSALLSGHNQARLEEKRPKLEAAAKLSAAALVHARDMAANGFMGHEGSDGSKASERVKKQGYHYRSTGENVANGYRSAASVMKAWMESPHHRDNIMGDYTEIGLAVVRDEEGQLFWCAEFGTPWPELDPENAATELLQAINKKRESARLNPLASNLKLEKVAGKVVDAISRSDDLGTTKDLGPVLLSSLKSAGYRYLSIAEVVGSGQPSAGEVVETWLKNPANRAAMMGSFTEAGVGCASAETGMPYWVLILGTPRPR